VRSDLHSLALPRQVALLRAPDFNTMSAEMRYIEGGEEKGVRKFKKKGGEEGEERRRKRQGREGGGKGERGRGWRGRKGGKTGHKPA